MFQAICMWATLVFRPVFSIAGILILTVFAATGAVSASTENDGIYKIAPVPGWVNEYKKPFEIDPQGMAPAYGMITLLAEKQFNLTGDMPEHYRHQVFKITNLEGVDDLGSHNFWIDPSYGDLDIHEISVLRNGEIYDRLKSAKIRTLQQEEELEYQVYDGYKTVNILVSNLQVGDVLSIKTTQNGINSVMAGEFFHEFETEWGVPIIHLNGRLLASKDKSVFFKSLGAEIDIQKQDLGNLFEYVWSKKNIKPWVSEADKPEWWEGLNETVQISSAESWNNVSRWGVGLYKDLDVENSEIKQIASNIRSSHATDEDRMIAALRYVQQEIRYVSISLGKGGFIPRPIDEILHTRYGDCKDKSSLLIALLRELEVEANLALVDTEEGLRLDRILPSFTVFDHVIVKAKIGSRSYWLDGTITHQGGDADHLQTPDYGYALLLDESNQSLEKMPDNGSGDLVLVDVLEKFDIGKPGKTAALNVITKYRGEEADRIRASIARSTEKLQKSYLDYYAGYYKKMLVLKPLSYEDDRKTNVVTIMEHYELENPWNQKTETDKSYFEFPSNYLRGHLKAPSGINRASAIEIKYPLSISHRIEAALPDALGWWEQLPSDKKSHTNEILSAEKTVEFDNGSYHISTSLRTKTHSVDAEDAAHYRNSVERANELFVLEYVNYNPQAINKIKASYNAPGNDFHAPGAVLSYWILLFTLAILSLPVMGTAGWLLRIPVIRRNNIVYDLGSVVKYLNFALYCQVGLLTFELMKILKIALYDGNLSAANKLIQSNTLLVIVSIILGAISIGLFFLWKMTAVHNANVIRNEKKKPFSAIYWYFVPIWWFWKPVTIMRGLGDGTLPSQKLNKLVGSWWLSYWLFHGLSVYYVYLQSKYLNYHESIYLYCILVLVEIGWIWIAATLIHRISSGLQDSSSSSMSSVVAATKTTPIIDGKASRL